MDTPQTQAATNEATVTVPPEVRAQIGEAMAKIMEAMPHLAAAMDRTIQDIAGERIPFTIVVFGKGFAMHGANIPKDASDNAIVEYGAALQRGGSNDATA